MLKTTPLLLLLAAVGQVSPKLLQFSGPSGLSHYDCPINFYGRTYRDVKILFDNTTAGVCFTAFNKSINDCLFMERHSDTTFLKVGYETISESPPDSLPNVLENATCQVMVEQWQDTNNPIIKYRIKRFGTQTVVQYTPLYVYTLPHVRFNVTVEGAVVLQVESNITRALSKVFYDLSGCRVSGPPHVVPDGYEEHVLETCFNRTCNAVTGQYTYKSKCENEELCINNLHRCVTVCSVTGSSVIGFNGSKSTIPDRCVYSLLRPQGNYSYELLAGFNERRRLDVPMLDYLKLSLQNPDTIIDLEQGGKVRVNGTTVALSSTSMVYGGVELSIDHRAVMAKLLFANITISFDGTTAQVSGPGLAAHHDGLCGNPVDPSQTIILSALNTSSENAAGCGIQHVDPNVHVVTSVAECFMMCKASFAACHDVIKCMPYMSACNEFLNHYPAVDGIQCQFVESYAEACRLSNVSLGDWRSATNCLAPPTSCLTQHCSSHEFCGESSTGAECYCRAGFASKFKSTNTLGEQAVCTQDSATLSLAVCLLTDKNIDYSLLSLNDPNCTGHLDQESHMVEFSFNSTNSCGSEVTTNNSQAIFKNTLSMRNISSNEIISRHSQVFINFSCLYIAPQPQVASLRVKEGSVVQQIQSGLLNYTLVLNTYNDSALTNMMGQNAEVMLNQKIWVKLKAEGLDGNLVALVTDSCWATNEPSPTATPRYSLISNGCSNPHDDTVAMKGNGLGMSNVFSFNMFEFSGRTRDVYLHCKLELCPKQSNSCTPSCGSGDKRRRRSLSRSRRAGESPALITLAWSN